MTTGHNARRDRAPVRGLPMRKAPKAAKATRALNLGARSTYVLLARDGEAPDAAHLPHETHVRVRRVEPSPVFVVAADGTRTLADNTPERTRRRWNDDGTRKPSARAYREAQRLARIVAEQDRAAAARDAAEQRARAGSAAFTAAE